MMLIFTAVGRLHIPLHVHRAVRPARKRHLPTRRSSGPAGGGAITGTRAVRPPGTHAAGRPTARFTAETTALSEARTMLVSIPTPHSTRSPTAHST